MGKGIPGRGNSMCNGTEAWKTVGCSKNMTAFVCMKHGEQVGSGKGWHPRIQVVERLVLYPGCNEDSGNQ